MIERLIPEFPALNIVDKAYVLFAYRALFVDGDTHVLNEEKLSVVIPIHTILDKLEELNVGNKLIESEGFTINISPFNNYSYEDAGSIFDCIEWIKYCGVTVEKGDIFKVVDSLPPRVFSTINKEIINNFEIFSNVEIISANDNAKLRAMHINLTDRSFGAFIMTLYKISLSSLFDNVFVYSQRMGSIDYFSMSPLDSQVLLNILQREVSKNAESKSNQHINPLTPYE